MNQQSILQTIHFKEAELEPLNAQLRVYKDGCSAFGKRVKQLQKEVAELKKQLTDIEEKQLTDIEE